MSKSALALFTICNNQVTNDEAQEYLFQSLPFPICKHDEPECHLKSLDIDDLNSVAQSLNPVVTLAMVELHPSTSQFAPHAKSLKNTVGGLMNFLLVHDVQLFLHKLQLNF